MLYVFRSGINPALFFIEAPCTSREVKALRVLFTSTLIIAATWKAGANALSSAHIDFPDV